MTVYASDLTQVLTTIRTTLAEKVGPGVTDSGARLELGMVIEQIDNLIGRTAWDPASVQRACEQTDQLAADLGVATEDNGSSSVDGLVRRRRAVAVQLRTTYAKQEADVAVTAAAVAEFSIADIRDQISVGMRAALPF